MIERERGEIIKDWQWTIDNAVGEVSAQRFNLQKAFRVEVERILGKPADLCKPAEINAARDAIPQAWWDEHKPKAPVDVTEPVPPRQSVLPF